MRWPHARKADEKLVSAATRGLNRFRLCLVWSAIVYLGLAGLAARWLPGEPFVHWVLLFFSAHSAAYLLVHGTGDQGDTRSS
jgi:hypothetical protein